MDIYINNWKVPQQKMNKIEAYKQAIDLKMESAYFLVFVVRLRGLRVCCVYKKQRQYSRY